MDVAATLAVVVGSSSCCGRVTGGKPYKLDGMAAPADGDVRSGVENTRIIICNRMNNVQKLQNIELSTKKK